MQSILFFSGIKLKEYLLLLDTFQSAVPAYNIDIGKFIFNRLVSSIQLPILK